MTLFSQETLLCAQPTYHLYNLGRNYEVIVSAQVAEISLCNNTDLQNHSLKMRLSVQYLRQYQIYRHTPQDVLCCLLYAVAVACISLKLC